MVSKRSSAFGSHHKTSIATTGLSGTLSEKLHAISTAGFDAVEIFENDLIQFPGSPRDVRKLCDDLGLEISMYQPFRDLEGTGSLAKQLARLENKFRVMKELNTDLILCCSNVNAMSSADHATIMHDLREAAKLAERHGIRIAYEALGWGAHVSHWKTSWDLVHAVDHPNLGICLDTFHIYSVGDSAVGVENIPGDKIFIIQFADAPVMKMDTLQYSRHYRTYPFQGGYPITDFCKRLVKTGYAGPYSLEIFNDEFRAAPALSTARDGLRSLLLLQETNYSNVIPGMPEVGGVEFVEFAVDSACIDALRAFFQDLGMVEIGKHRSKSTFLYGNGKTKLIINAQTESFASSFFLHHGVSACAICVNVKSVSDVLNRAVALNYSVVHQDSRAEGELELIAVQAPDESLIYVTDSSSSWLGDFDLTPHSSPDSLTPSEDGVVVKEYTASGDFDGIDHISQALDRLSLDRFTLFYRSLLGMKPAQVYELNDPYGLVKSKAMISETGSLRFPLNVSEQSRTGVGRFVGVQGGSGVQSIAISSKDIFATVNTMSKRLSRSSLDSGLELLQIPDNYYADLQLRFDLSDEFLGRLKSHGIMYDKDAHGEYLHTSTSQFEDRFFFDIVQRLDQYDQFGSLNAGLRMTIHHELRNLKQSLSHVAGVKPSPKLSAHKKQEKSSLLIFYADGQDFIVDIISEMAGLERSADLQALKANSNDGLVVGISWSDAQTTKSELLSLGSRINLINTICIDGSDEHEDGDWISEGSRYEYLYSKRPFDKKDLARFLSFVLGQHDPNEPIARKQVTNFIAITYPDVRVALQNLDILTLGADAIELRVDFLREPSGTGNYNSIPSIKFVGQQVMALRRRTELPIIYTLRSSNEGGRWPIEANAESHFYLKKALQWGCEFVDVEVRLSEEIRGQLYSDKGRSKIISSYHDLSGRLKWSSTDTQLKYHAARQYGDVVKLIGFANTLADNYELEHFRSSITSTFSHPLLAINAGQNGQLSRVLNNYLSPTTHPLLPVAAAPGQLSAAEINGALHILGQLPTKRIYSIGNFTASPLSKFYEKFFHELSLPHTFSEIDRAPISAIEALVRQKDFGGASLHPPLNGHPAFINSITQSAQEIGQVDTIVSRSQGNMTVTIGDNTAWRGIRASLTQEYVSSAFYRRSALVLATSAETAAASIYALKSLSCSTIYTIGFESAQFDDLEHLVSVEKIQGTNPIAVISVLPAEKSHSMLPLIKMLDSSSSNAKPILVDLANGPKRGDPLGLANAQGWSTYGLGDVFARATMEVLKVLIAQNVAYDFVRMATGKGHY